MDRITFLDSISGINYPEMLVQFFDQFFALKMIVEDKGHITVNESDQNSISFIIEFDTKETKDIALSNVVSNYIVIYGKQVFININILDDRKIKIILQ